MKNTRVNESVMIDVKHLEDFEKFTYLDTKMANYD